MRCSACNCEIEVVWRMPEGASAPILENLCLVCQAWAEVAKQPFVLPAPSARRKPVIREHNNEVEGSS